MQVRIRGQGFHPWVQANYDDESRSSMRTSFLARLGSSVLQQVRLLSGTELSAVVPAGLAPGWYTLTVTDPRQREGALERAYQVLAPSLADGGREAGKDLDSGPADRRREGPGADGPRMDGPRLDVPRPDGPRIDGQKKDTILTDVGGGVCIPWIGNWTLQTPQEVTELNTSGMESNPVIAADGLTIHFSSNRSGGKGDMDLYVAKRPSPGAPFANIQNLGALNTSAAERCITFSANGLTAVLTSEWPGGSGWSDLWLGTRSSTAVPFAPSLFTALTVLNTSNNDYDGHISTDGLRIYYTISYWSKGLGGMDIVLGQRSSVGAAFTAPVLVQALDTSSDDHGAALTQNELLVLFASTRPGGQGSSDLYYAYRPNTGATFNTPKNAPAVNTSSYEGEVSIAADNCEVFFCSDRPGGKGSWDIYKTRWIKIP